MSAPNKLIEKIEGFTRKYYLNRLIQGVLVGAVLWIVFYLLINGLEYFSWFPPKGRFVLFLFLLAGSGFVLVYHFLIPLVNLIRFRKKMSVEQASVMIGKFFPEIKDKLLNTIQLSNQMEALNSTSAVGPSTGSGTSVSSGSGTENDLLAATIEQRSARLSPIRFSDAVDLRGNLKWLGVFFGLLLLLILLMVFLPSFAVQPTQRIVNYEQSFEKPLPYQVEIEQDEIETTQGQEVKFNIHVTGGRIPDAFYVKSELGQQLMTRGSVNDFSYTFKNLYHDLTFNVVGGEYSSRPLHIIVHPNPTLLSYRCDVHYPAYIHRSNETLEAKTRLIVPQGTNLTFSFITRDTEKVTLTRDSLVTDPLVNSIHHTQILNEYLDHERCALPEQLEPYIALIKEPFFRDVIIKKNDYYKQLMREKAAAVNRVIHPSSDVEGLTDGKAIIDKIVEPYRGKIVYLDIWGTWCAPCKRKLSESHELKTELKDYDIVYLYLANRSPEKSWKNVIAEYNLTEPNCVHYNLPANQQHAVEQYVGLTGYPTYRLFDKQGRMHHLNWLDDENLSEFKKKLDALDNWD